MNEEQEKHMYLRLRHKLEVRPDQEIYLRDIAQYIVHPSAEQELVRTPVYTVSEQDEHLVVMDVMKVIQFVRRKVPGMKVESFGPEQTILEIVYPARSPVFLLVLFVWVLLFIGSGLAIMHFHEDVNMLAVHQKLFTMLTGQENEHPLLLQIPYSIGIGVGMILFFNRVFKKKLNEEPSPLELEMYNYQQNLDQYVIMKENKEVQKKLDDPT